jgi:hypothetical protein
MTTVSITPPATALTGKPKLLFDRAKQVLETVINDPEFEEKVREREFTSRLLLTDTGQKEQADDDTITLIIASGKESQENPGDTVIEMTVELASLAVKVLGEVVPPNPAIRVNRTFFDECVAADDPVALAAVLMHEWMHVAGFRHPGNGTKRDVPFGIGKIVEELGRALPQPDLGGAASLDVGAGAPAAVDLGDWECHVTDDRGGMRRKRPPRRRPRG